MASRTLASRCDKPKPSSNKEVSRIRLTFESPAPLISAIPGRLRMLWVTSSWSESSSATTTSRSPMVSLRRRALPANSARITPGNSRIKPTNVSPYRKPISSLLRALKRASKSIPDRILACDLAPNPESGAISLFTAAACNSGMLSIPNSSCNCLIRFGPTPGIPNISNNPDEVFSCSSCQSSGQTPVKTAPVIAEPKPLPIPLMSNNSPDATNSPKSCVNEPTIRLPF